MSTSKAILIGAAMLAAAGCMGDRDDQASTSKSDQSATAAGSASGSLSSSDREFIAQAASQGLFEVRSSELALRQPQLDSKHRQFAQRMITDHSKANQELMRIAKAQGVDVSQKMQPKHQQQFDKLQGLSGDAFSQQYHQAQMQGHDEAISLCERQTREGQNQEIKSFAQRTLPTLREHRDMMKQQHQSGSGQQQ